MAAGHYLEFDEGRKRLPVTKILVIGRSTMGDVVLPHPTVSQVHCRILPEAGAVAIEDTSANGTSVNGVRIRGRVGLNTGDVIQIGPYLLRLAGGASKTAPKITGRSVPPASFAIEVAKLDTAVVPGALDETAFQDSIQAAGRVLVVFAGNLRIQERRDELLGRIHQSLREATGQSLRPNQIVARLNNLLVEQAAQATGVCVRIDAADRRLHCACAAHHPPWIASRVRPVAQVESAPSLELGRLKSARYSMDSFQLEVGESVVLISDGLPQAIADTPEAGLALVGERVGAGPPTPAAVAERLRAALNQRAAAIRPPPASWAICIGLQPGQP